MSVENTSYTSFVIGQGKLMYYVTLIVIVIFFFIFRMNEDIMVRLLKLKKKLWQ